MDSCSEHDQRVHEELILDKIDLARTQENGAEDQSKRIAHKVELWHVRSRVPVQGLV